MSYNSLVSMDWKLKYSRFELTMKKTARKYSDQTRNNKFFKRIENRQISQNSWGGTLAKFSKLAKFLSKLWKAKTIRNTNLLVAKLV